jgi:hypothetical protein
MGTSTMTAVVSPRRGATADVNGPEVKPIRKTIIAESALALVARTTRMTAVVNGSVLSRRLSLEDFITLGKLHPSLLPTSPYVSRGPQPGCIIQRAASDADHAIPRQAADPGTAL